MEGLLRVDEEAARVQIDRLTQLRKKRDDAEVQAALERLERVAQTDENTVPAILECVESYCTLGEISGVFRSVFGEQEESFTF